jgi:hypothetical protein
MATFMMESILYFGIGSLLGALPAVALSLPVINRRARREASSASQLVERGRGDGITRLKIDLGALGDRLHAAEEELKVKAAAAREAQCSLSDKESELAKLKSAFDERSALIDLQKTDLVAAGIQVETLKGRLAQMGEEVKAAEERRHGIERAFSDKEMEMATLTSAFGERCSLADSQKLEIEVLGTQVQALQERLFQCGEETKALEGLREAAECALSERDSKLVATTRALDERSALADSQKGEIAALTMQIETRQGRVTQAEEEVNAVESRRVAALRSLSEKEAELARLTISLNEGSALVESQKTEIVALMMQVQRLNEQLVQASAETRAVEAQRDGAMRALSEKESVLAEPTTTLAERPALVELQNTEFHKLNELLVQATAETRTVEGQGDAAACILSEEESAATRLAIALNECSVPQDAKKVANAALRVQIRALNERLIHAGKEAEAVEKLREAERRELKEATKELMEERGKFDNFYQHVTGLVEQLTAKRTADEILHRRAREDLENRLIVQSRLLNESESEIRHLRDELDSACKAENDMRVAIIEIEGRGNAAAENFVAEKARLEAALHRANGERARLVHELSDLKRRQGEEARAAEPVDGTTLGNPTNVARLIRGGAAMAIVR